MQEDPPVQTAISHCAKHREGLPGRTADSSIGIHVIKSHPQLHPDLHYHQTIPQPSSTPSTPRPSHPRLHVHAHTTDKPGRWPSPSPPTCPRAPRNDGPGESHLRSSRCWYLSVWGVRWLDPTAFCLSQEEGAGSQGGGEGKDVHMCSVCGEGDTLCERWVSGVEGTAGTREFVALLHDGMLAVSQVPHQQWSRTALMTNS
jgi:hypothetical protein